MYTTHSSPKRAQTVAVATPCWPAPVSAMIRRFPIRSASSAWPIVLLILCAPVWFRSSRLSTTVRAGLGAEPGRLGQRRGPAHELRQQRLVLRPEGGIAADAVVQRREIVERGDERLGHVPPAVGTEASRRRPAQLIALWPNDRLQKTRDFVGILDARQALHP